MLARVLTLALLFAQAGAIGHAYSHLSDDPGERQGIARGCGQCLAASQLHDAVGGPPPPFPQFAMAWATRVAEATTAVFHLAPVRAFRSRAPPAFV